MCDNSTTMAPIDNASKEYNLQEPGEQPLYAEDVRIVQSLQIPDNSSRIDTELWRQSTGFLCAAAALPYYTERE
jgi:hypothetical protein